MALTGRADGPPLGPPQLLVPRLAELGRQISADSAVLGRPVELDPLALLGERAAGRGLRRAGAVSCGGHSRLLRAADGWYAVSLARPEDTALVPAWLALREPPADPWRVIERRGSTRDRAELVDRARRLGLPAAVLPDPGRGRTLLPVRTRRVADAPPVRSLADLTVVDLSALWAGPLAASILDLAGARVIRVESTRRPDPMRHGDPTLFDLLNGGKRSVAIDLGEPAGVAALGALLRRADVVVEASRPGALEQLGISAEALLSEVDGPRVWLSITGYGRAAPGRDWTALGDDAAVAGGLVATDEQGPCFVADAVADPGTGLVAAAAALRALKGGGRWLLAVAMAEVAAQLSGPTLPVDPDLLAEVAPPRSRPPTAQARPLGADTHTVLSPVSTVDW